MITTTDTGCTSQFVPTAVRLPNVREFFAATISQKRRRKRAVRVVRRGGRREVVQQHAAIASIQHNLHNTKTKKNFDSLLFTASTRINSQPAKP